MLLCLTAHVIVHTLGNPIEHTITWTIPIVTLFYRRGNWAEGPVKVTEEEVGRLGFELTSVCTEYSGPSSALRA